MKAVDDLDLEQLEVPESPGIIQASPATIVQSRRHSDGDGGVATAAVAAVTQAVPASTKTDSVVEDPHEQKQEKEGQGWEDTSNGADRPLPSRQPDAPVQASTIQLLDFGLVPDRQSREAVLNHYPETQSASRIVSAEKVACTESEPCVSIQDDHLSLH